MHRIILITSIKTTSTNSSPAVSVSIDDNRWENSSVYKDDEDDYTYDEDDEEGEEDDNVDVINPFQFRKK